jgi:hypothetical protein
MFNAVNKYAILGCITLWLSACSNNTDDGNSGAEDLYNQIEAAISAKNNQLAIELIDSLNKAYPKDIKTRGMALKLKPKAIEGQTIEQIQSADAELAVLEAKVDSLGKLFEKVSSPEIVESYYVQKDTRNKSLMTSTAIEPRLSEGHEFYIEAIIQGLIGLNRIALDSANSNVIPQGDDRSFATGSCELAIFAGDDAKAIGEYATTIPNKGATLTFKGTKGNRSITLNAKQVSAIANAYTYSTSYVQLQKCRMERERLERQLQIARDQIANSL